MANNIYHKYMPVDYWNRDFYPKNSRRRYKRYIKRANNRKFRRQIFRKEQEI